MSAPAFVHSVRVRPLDCDRQGVVGHPRYLHFFDSQYTNAPAAAPAG